MPAPKPTAIPTRSTLDTSQGDATTALYSAAIGPISNDYYLPVFTEFEAAGSFRLTWNWAACLYTFNWMIFRGMRLAAIVYAATAAGLVLLFGLGRMIFQFSSTTELALTAALLGLMFCIPGLLGNRLLHTACRKKMANALRDSATLPDACTLLTLQASSRQRFLWLVSVNAVAMAVALALYLLDFPLAKEPAGASAPPATQQVTEITPLTLRTEPSSRSEPVVHLQPTQSGPVTNAETPAPAASEIPADTASAPRPIPTTTPSQASPTVLVSSAAALRYRYYINVGLFAKEANAQNALNKLEQAGLSTLSSTVSTARGERTRVRAGPYKTDSDANAAAQRIRALNLDAVVMRQSF